MRRTYLVRHGKAGDRYRFSGADRHRPLSSAGHRQAHELAQWLAREAAPARILSSPAARCVQTVEPLAEAVGVTLEVVDWLDEGSDVSTAMERLRPEGSLVACTHGDVIWGVLELLARSGVDLGERPDAQKGSVWMLDWDDSNAELPLRAVYLPPPEKAGAGSRKRRSP